MIEENLSTLWKGIIKHSQKNNTLFHGPEHWARVERNGIYLAKEEGIDNSLIRLFALFHDCQRVHDGWDESHGKRASEFIGQIKEILPPLSDSDLNLLKHACEHHTTSKHSDNIIVGTCWDADRLDLDRVGITPKAQYFNTTSAKRIVLNKEFERLETIPTRETKSSFE